MRTRMAVLAVRLADRRSFRLRVALVMAAVSLASAYVTYVASERDATAASLNALASEQWAEEQQVEQQVDAIVAQDQRLTARLDAELHTFRDTTEKADALRATDPDRAAQLDLDAQASAALFAQLEPFLRSVQPDLTGDVATFDTDAAREKARFFDWRLFRASSELTRDDARHATDMAASTVLIVVVLVAALFLLTLAHVAGGRRGVIFAVLGVASAIIGIAWFTALDIGAALPLVVAVVAVVIMLSVARLGPVRRWLEGIEKHAIDDVHTISHRPGATATTVPVDPPTTGYNRYVAVAIAVSTLLGAGVGYLHGQASSSSQNQSWLGVDLGVEAIGDQRAAEERLAVSLESYQEALANRVDGWDASQRASYAAWSGDTQQVEPLTQEAERLEELAARYEERSGVARQLGSSGVTGEAVFQKLGAEVWESSARLLALQDAANAAARAWSIRSGIFLSVLAWLAVAAYLLGLSLIFKDRRVHSVLASVGTVLILAAVVRTATAWAEPEPPTASQAATAADAYARGVVASFGGDPGRAEKLFARALELRPDFGLASRERAQALLEGGSAPGLGVRGAFTVDAVNEAIDELRAARVNRADTAGVNLDLGAMLFQRSIQTGSMTAMQRSVEFTRTGLALGETYEDKHGSPHVYQLIGEINLAVSLLGTGEVDAAERELRMVGKRIAALELGLRRFLVSAALVPLGLLAETSDPPPAEAIVAMKELVVTEGYGLSPGVASPARITSTRIERFGPLLHWRADIPGFDPARDMLAVQWYRLDPDVKAWGAIPTTSGPVSIGNPDVADTAHRDSAAGRDVYSGDTGATLDDVPPTCVQPGLYRVELYLNGSLQGTAEADVSPAQSRFDPLPSPDVGVSLCRPEGWSATGTPGSSTAAISPDGSRGVAVMRVHQPRASVGVDARLGAVERVIADGPAGLPVGLGPGTGLQPAAQPPVFGFDDSLWQLRSYPDGVARISATTADTGTVFVTCLFGPPTWVESDEAGALLLSVIPAE